MSVCYIFSGGKYSINDLKTFDIPKPDYVISADAGFINASLSNFKTECLIGDFDTLKTLPEKDYVGEIQRFKCEKDDTDTMLAARLAVKKGYDEIYFFGALGGRLDHSFANIQTLNFVSNNKKRGFIISENEFVTILLPGKHYIKKKNGFTLSLFSISEKTEGISVIGTKYTLNDGNISYDFPIGVCNEIVSSEAEISFSKGKLLVICSKNISI